MECTKWSADVLGQLDFKYYMSIKNTHVVVTKLAYLYHFFVPPKIFRAIQMLFKLHSFLRILKINSEIRNNF